MKFKEKVVYRFKRDQVCKISSPPLTLEEERLKKRLKMGYDAVHDYEAVQLDYELDSSSVGSSFGEDELDIAVQDLLVQVHHEVHDAVPSSILQGETKSLA